MDEMQFIWEFLRLADYKFIYWPVVPTATATNTFIHLPTVEGIKKSRSLKQKVTSLASYFMCVSKANKYAWAQLSETVNDSRKSSPKNQRRIDHQALLRVYKHLDSLLTSIM